MFPARLRRLFSNYQSIDRNEDASTRQPEALSDAETFYPSLWEVLKTRHILQWKAFQQSLPAELVDAIIDAAEYWASTERRMEDVRRITSDRDQVLLKTVPLCYDRKSLERSKPLKPLPHRTLHPCRKIIFRISSHDQGHGPIRENMYNNSCTWFDTEVIKAAHTKSMYADGTEQEILDNERGQEKKHFAPDDELLLPRNNKLKVNGSRVSEPQNSVITWHYLDDVQPDSEEAYEIETSEGRGRCTLDGHGVCELEVGDSIALWARARFPGWINHVDFASVRVFWAV
ncbi:hypothetical protein N7448_008232 [Penicillium atrosanguineum]|uniref:Uncharacterized protein n=1 Tax=Penicillium atrosanguineum TaxID=1132637 RepID=A0A9W9UC37_9EURO|nr:uncharacterized protein N7443_000754 [Penicillium atrosanguineum]KAJ5127453.1 hypothetical protein N7448_008232 [Penicillium atrosanguineum]KAJ5147657.1 hypothetical protein N7526_001009 [Penicillium atrosanguineum]KAJ5313870.1 hypothetical protein N7443_000754 [Penicillium atrosanguineum]KAJ5331041.1 hypothetical protein N7476_000824 [Penicillium atrosanguineum]